MATWLCATCAYNKKFEKCVFIDRQNDQVIPWPASKADCHLYFPDVPPAVIVADKARPIGFIKGARPGL